MPVNTYSPSIESRDIARRLTGSNRTYISKSIRNKIVTFNDNVIDNLAPKVAYHIHQVKAVDPHKIVLNNHAVFMSPKLAKTMRYSTEMVCFLATAGPELDAEIARLTATGRMSGAYVLDVMGSLLVERMVERFQESFGKKMAAHGKDVTLRFSPGYCDWPITQQSTLFTLFDSSDIGVKLHRSCLMTPRKSISGVFGIYALNDVSERYIPCWECNRSDCTARRAEPRSSVDASATY